MTSIIKTEKIEKGSYKITTGSSHVYEVFNEYRSGMGNAWVVYRVDGQQIDNPAALTSLAGAKYWIEGQG